MLGFRSQARRSAALWIACGLVAPAHANAPPVLADSTQALPFLAAPRAGDRFACSNLTRLYARDLTSFSNPRPQPTDLARLDATGASRGQSPVDSTDISLVDAQRAAQANEIPDEEKRVLTPPAAGARVGIPGPGAAIAATVGGIALLAKVIADLFR